MNEERRYESLSQWGFFCASSPRKIPIGRHARPLGGRRRRAAAAAAGGGGGGGGRADMARQRAALLAGALAVVACAAAAPFTLVANVVSHSEVRVGAAPPQVLLHCPPHPGLRCSSRVSGHQVLINVFHDPSTIVNSWTGGGVEEDHKRTTDRSGQEDEGSREETFEEDNVSNTISNSRSSKPDRVLRKYDIFENEENFGIPESTTVSGEQQESNDHPVDNYNFISQGEDEQNNLDDYDTEGSVRSNHNTEQVASSQERNDDHENYLKNNDETSSQERNDDHENYLKNNDETSSQERNDDHENYLKNNDETTPHSLDNSSENTEAEHTHRSLEESNDDNNDSGIETTTQHNVSWDQDYEENVESNRDNVDDNEEGETPENVQDSSMSMVTTSNPLLYGKFWNLF